jgi:hypothetical protein
VGSGARLLKPLAGMCSVFKGVKINACNGDPRSILWSGTTITINNGSLSNKLQLTVADDSSLRQAIKLKLKGKSGLVKICNQA